ncbi:hypothetical protein AZE42_00706 [Rhizopogon vesiculosus]|uniref:Uncharacterized protein n=1 Tax=Rhizopogon vesiculosus TaxID=180088 RepID=A0A1J8PIY2_9AGAM|nr:hypothetical protein AZE42_00706 [Rhizopogon vesiculosus]
MSIPSPDHNHPPTHFPDRRKSMDVGFLRLVHHPFARVAKEKNDAIFLRSPLSPAGSGQSMSRQPSGLPTPGMRTASYGSSSSSYNPYPRPPLAHRASEPHVFAPIRSPFPHVQEVPSSSHMSQRHDHRFAASSRALPSPIPGPLPKPDFQFGAPSSGSPSNASPDADSPNLHTWAFPRNETDQDTEDSVSSIGLSRFGSIASACGSDTSATSAIYSDVSSCVGVDHMAFDPNARRGSCASNSLLETRMSSLNMRSSQGSINEAHLKAASSSLAYPHREHLLSQERGYSSPASTVSPVGSPHGKDPGPFGLRTSEHPFGYNSVPPEPNSNTYLSPTEPAPASRRPSIPTIQEGIPHSHIQNSLEHNHASSYPPPIDTTPPPNAYHFTPKSSGYSHTGNYTSPGPFSRDGTFSPTDTSYAQPGMQYPPEGNFAPSASSYAQPSADYSFATSPTNGREHFNTYN